MNTTLRGASRDAPPRSRTGDDLRGGEVRNRPSRPVSQNTQPRAHPACWRGRWSSAPWRARPRLPDGWRPLDDVAVGEADRESDVPSGRVRPPRRQACVEVRARRIAAGLPRRSPPAGRRTRQEECAPSVRAPPGSGAARGAQAVRSASVCPARCIAAGSTVSSRRQPAHGRRARPRRAHSRRRRSRRFTTRVTRSLPRGPGNLAARGPGARVEARRGRARRRTPRTVAARGDTCSSPGPAAWARRAGPRAGQVTAKLPAAHAIEEEDGGEKGCRSPRAAPDVLIDVETRPARPVVYERPIHHSAPAQRGPGARGPHNATTTSSTAFAGASPRRASGR